MKLFTISKLLNRISPLVFTIFFAISFFYSTYLYNIKHVLSSGIQKIIALIAFISLLCIILSKIFSLILTSNTTREEKIKNNFTIKDHLVYISSQIKKQDKLKKIKRKLDLTAILVVLFASLTSLIETIFIIYFSIEINSVPIFYIGFIGTAICSVLYIYLTIILFKSIKLN